MKALIFVKHWDIYGMEITSYLLDGNKSEVITSVTMKEAQNSTEHAKDLLHSYTMDCLDTEQLERFREVLKKPHYYSMPEHVGISTTKELKLMLQNKRLCLICDNAGLDVTLKIRKEYKEHNLLCHNNLCQNKTETELQVTKDRDLSDESISNVTDIDVGSTS